METQMTPNSQNHLEKEQSWRSHALTSDYTTKLRSSKQYGGDFPGGPVVKTSPSNAGGVGSIPVRGAKILHASQPKNQNIKQKQYCNKFNKDFKNGPHQKNSKKPKQQYCTSTKAVTWINGTG